MNGISFARLGEQGKLTEITGFFIDQPGVDQPL